LTQKLQTAYYCDAIVIIIQLLPESAVASDKIQECVSLLWHLKVAHGHLLTTIKQKQVMRFTVRSLHAETSTPTCNSPIAPTRRTVRDNGAAAPVRRL
jgi:hypothetical protein